jgi:hypothetical protein
MGAYEALARIFEDEQMNNDPVQWALERAGVHLWSIQRDIARSVSEHGHTAVQSAHGLGKSFLAAVLAAWWIDTHPPDDTIVISTAPSQDQVHGILWEEIRGLHSKANLRGIVQRTDRWLIGDRIVGMGRKPPDYSQSAFQGWHRRFVLVVLDEACGIPSGLWTAVETVTTGQHCRILAIGNPDDPNSHFRRLCQGAPGWKSFKISCFDSPNFTGEPVPDYLREVLTPVSWADERAAEWGIDNPLYISKVLGEFPTDHPWSVVRMSDLYACGIPAPRTQKEMLPVELGVDVGGGGDETVIRERRGIIAGREWRERSDRPETISRLVLAAINQSGATRVKVDAIGIGAGLVGELRNLRDRGAHNADIIAVSVSERASDPNMYYNLRSQIWWEVGRLAAEARIMDLSRMENADATIAQLLEPRYKHDLRGRIQVEPKDEIRKRAGRSPDNADALLLAFYTPPGISVAEEWFDLIKTGRY